MRRILIAAALIAAGGGAQAQQCTLPTIQFPSVGGSPYYVVRLGPPDDTLSGHSTFNRALDRAAEARARDQSHEYRVRQTGEWRIEVCIPDRADTVPAPPDSTPTIPPDTTAPPDTTTSTSAQSIVWQRGDGITAPVGSTRAFLLLLTDSAGPVAGEPLTWAVSAGATLVSADPRTGSNGLAEGRWQLGPTAGDYTLTVTTASGATATATATATDSVVTQPPIPPDTTTPPPTLPPADSSDITPAVLRHILGPLVARGTNPNGWPSHYDANLDRAVARLVSVVSAGTFDPVTDGAGGDNSHYGPFELVVARNIRAGLPLDETDAAFAAGLMAVRRTVREYMKPNDYLVSQINRYTNWMDCEIVWWLYRADPGDNGQLADECRTLIWQGAIWGTTHVEPNKMRANHQWMGARIMSLALEMAMAADRVGIAFGSRPGFAEPHYITSGATTWEGWIRFAVGQVKKVQDEACTRFGGQTEPGSGVVIRCGAIRSYGVLANGVEPYASQPWMDAMLANALLRVERQYGCPECVQMAVDLTVTAHDYYNASAKALPLTTRRTDAAADLNMFWPPVLLSLYQETGQTWMRDTAIGLVDGSRNGAWTWRLKQAQELGAATEPQRTEALLAGMSWR